MPRPSLLQVVVVLLLAMLGLMAVSVAYRTRNQRTASTATAAQPAAPSAPALRAAGRREAGRGDSAEARGRPSAKPAPKLRPTFSVARVRPGRSVALRSKPSGPVIARVPSTTQFGSPATLAVAATHGRWQG